MVCGCFLYRGQRGEVWCVSSTLGRYEIRMGLLLVLSSEERSWGRVDVCLYYAGVYLC